MGSEILDVRGKICPVPSLLTKRKLESMNPGEVLEVVSDYPQTRDNIQDLVRRDGNEILKVEELNGAFKIVIRKSRSREKGRIEHVEFNCPSSGKH